MDLVRNVLCLATVLSSVSGAIAADKRINLANKSDLAGTFELGFCARPSPSSAKGWPGHAFVSFSQKSPEGARTFSAIGHTVAPGVGLAKAGWSLFGSPVPGILKEENYTSVMEECLIVEVNKEDFDKALGMSKSPLEKAGLKISGPLLEVYVLGAEDCVAWMIGIANLIRPKGLKVPERKMAESPMPYMRRLVETR